MRMVVKFVFIATVVSTAVAQSYITNPSNGTVFSVDVNGPGPTISCKGYNDLGGTLYQQITRWSITEPGKNTTLIQTSSATFMLSSDTIEASGLIATSTLTVLNATSNLDGATVVCFFINVGVGGVFTLKLYRPPVLKSVGTVTAVRNNSVTFQIGDTSSPPPYPQTTLSFSVVGNGTLSPNQLQYNHPNLTLTGLTEDNSGSYVVTATNYRLNDGTIIGSSRANLNLNVQFPPVITTGPSLVASVIGQPTSLVCGTNLRSNPPSSIAWRDSRRATVTNGGRFVFGNGSDSVHLNISNTTLSDNGTWTCILNNGILAPLTLNISLFVVVPPSQPGNVTSNSVDDETTQLYISWQPPSDPGIPPVSLYVATATSSLDPNPQTLPVNTTAVRFTGLLPGLSYDITVMAVSVFGGVSAMGPPSDKVTFSTVPTVPTLMCGPLTPASGKVNVSWIIVYNGGRDISAVHIEFTQAGTEQQYQPIQDSVTPNTTFAIVGEKFYASRSYSFRISVNNTVGRSNVVECGSVLIKEGIPLRPDAPDIKSPKPGTLTITLSIAASGAGTTGTFAFLITSIPPIDTLLPVYQFPSYVDGQKVSISVTNVPGGNIFFTVQARNAFGISEFQNELWMANNTEAPSTVVPGTGSTQSQSVAGPVAGGVIGGIIFVLLILIIIVIIYLVLKQRGGTYQMDTKTNNKGGVKVEEIDVDVGDSEAKQEIHYAELGSFKPREPVQQKQTVAQKAAEEEPVTYSTVQIPSATFKGPGEEVGHGAATKTDTSTTMV